MLILDYTTKVPVAKTVAEIEAKARQSQGRRNPQGVRQRRDRFRLELPNSDRIRRSDLPSAC